MQKRRCVFLLILLISATAFSQTGSELGGVVRDNLSTPLSGVTVAVTGSSRNTVTDQQGRYRLTVLPTDSIDFSFVGYRPLRMAVRNMLEINVSLEPVAGSLDEVAVVAFGRQKKISVVGAQSTVSAEELKLPVRDLTNALAGRLAGVVAVQRSGEPGYDASELYIRGISTFASSPRSPLLVVDGVPDRSINNIDPEDIESFTMLKDASATAVYGTRGANGVIMVNTKKGKAGKALINVELNQGASKFTQLPDFVDAIDYMRMFNEGEQMRGKTAQFTEETIQKYIDKVDPDLYPNSNWFDELFNKYGSSQRANLNVRGGSQTATYYISAGYYGEMGMFKRDEVQTYNSALKYNRFNFTSNVNVDLTKTTKLELGINGFITNGNYPGVATPALFNYATTVAPHRIPARYSNGQWPKEGGTHPSPYMSLTQSGYATEFSNTLRSNIRVRQELDFVLKGLSFTSMFSFDNFSATNQNRTRTLPTYFVDFANNGGRDAEGNLITKLTDPGNTVLGFASTKSTNRRFYTETGLNYSNTFGYHTVSAMALFNQSDYVNGDATTVEGSIPFRVRGLTGRATYGFQNKYFVEGNFGYTGSENFVPGKRYGLFPSIGAGYVVSNEKFFEPLKNAISHFKIRYSYGLSGNSNPGARFLFLSQIAGNTSGYTFGEPGNTRGFNGWGETHVGSDVTWETSKRHNLGIEINTLNNDLQVIVELFKERREGILIRDLTIPYSSGYTASNLPFGNIGITENKGIDATLTYNKSFGRNTFISFTGTFNYNVNKNIYDGLPPWKYPWLNPQGNVIGQRFGLVALGLFKDSAEILASPRQLGDTRPGDIKYKDINGDGVINTADDNVAIGFGAMPRIIYGLNFGFGYKGFDLSLFFQGAGMVDFNYAGGFATTPFSQGATYGNMYSMVTDRWTPEKANSGTQPFYPRLSTNSTVTTNYATSTWWVKRADYIRLKSAELGYNFGTKVLRRFHVSKMRLFVNGTNLFTQSKWNVWDPELGDGRGASYPNTTMYNAGFRISFN